MPCGLIQLVSEECVPLAEADTQRRKQARGGVIVVSGSSAMSLELELELRSVTNRGCFL